MEPESGTRVIEAVLARPPEAELLQVPIGSALFRLHVVTRAEGGRPLACSELWLRGDRTLLHVDLGIQDARGVAFEPLVAGHRDSPSLVAGGADADWCDAASETEA
jgi:hypothetical protein